MEMVLSGLWHLLGSIESQCSHWVVLEFYTCRLCVESCPRHKNTRPGCKQLVRVACYRSETGCWRAQHLEFTAVAQTPAWFPTPTLGDSHLPITPAPGDPRPRTSISIALMEIYLHRHRSKNTEINKSL